MLILSHWGTREILCKSSSDSANCLLLGLTFLPTFFRLTFTSHTVLGPGTVCITAFVSDLAQLITNSSQSLCLQPPKGQTFKLASIKCLSIVSSIDVLLSQCLALCHVRIQLSSKKHFAQCSLQLPAAAQRVASSWQR